MCDTKEVTDARSGVSYVLTTTYKAPLEPWQERLIAEYTDVRRRIAGLHRFLARQAIKQTIADHALELMEEQLHALKFYRQAIEQRLTYHKIKAED